jgi:uncharacterized RDD family membrane protein YckC
MGSFGARFMRENTILSGVSIRPAALVNTTFQATDTSKPVSLAIHVERNNNNNPSTTGNNGLVEEGRGGQILNNTLRETVRNPNGMVMTSNEFTKQFFTTFKPDVTGKYTITIYNLGNTPVTVDVLVGNLPFVGPNNQVNVNFFGGIVAGVFLTIAGIIVLIAGVIVLALDRRKRVSPDQTISSSPSTTATTTATTNTQRIVLASWIDRFIAWLIDVVIVSIGLGILFALISIPFWAAVSQSFDVGSTYINMAPRNVGSPWFPYIISSIVFMGYWTYFESTSGQSIGKRVMHLRTTDLNGNTLDIRTAAIESFGKAFFLPFDVLFGWIFTNDKRQRIFNRVSDSVVVKLREAEDYDTSRNTTYMKD